MFHVEPKSEIKTHLIEGLKILSINMEQSAVTKIVDYFNLLLERNNSLNLISQKQDLKTKIAVHLLDSLSPLLWDELTIQAVALDFGSGGGLPAIPLSIVRPGWNYTLIESTGKKTLFLAEIQKTLQFNNITVINNYLNPNVNKENHKFDIITARAVSNLTKLISIVGPRLKKNGIFISFKGPQADIELADAKEIMKKWNIELIHRLEFKLPFVNADRILLFFKKL